MLLNEVLHRSCSSSQMQAVLTECSTFLRTNSGPLFKMLPSAYGDVRRVKVRKRKPKSASDLILDEAFSTTFAGLSQRSVYVHTRSPTTAPPGQELYYVVPIDGYQAVFHPEVISLKEHLNVTANVILSNFKDEDRAAEILVELAQNTISANGLCEATMLGVDALVYNIPYYYAVRCAAYPDYILEDSTCKK